MCEPRSSDLRSSRISIPPTHDAIVALAIPYNQVNSRLTCIANSRVGAITKAKGAPALSKFTESFNIVGAMAMPNPTVFPDPVCAETNKSEFSNSFLLTSDCTGVSVS